MTDICTRYVTFPGLNLLDMLMCIQMLHNDYGILQTGICQALGIVGRSPAYSQVSHLAKTYQNLSWEICATIFIAFSIQ